MTALSRRQRTWICKDTRRTGLYRTFASPPEEETSWIEFGYAAQIAAAQSGFSRNVAAQLVGAIGEIQSNIYEHSQAPLTGLVAFKATPGIFQFVVCGRGIGVLQSLRRCADYCNLADHGQALKLTLTEGVSRYGPQRGRGLGFRPLFTGLANLNGSLRFRSGDHALTIDGCNPGAIPAKLSKKPPMNGFLISATCYL
jgi:hypothetical protein